MRDVLRQKVADSLSMPAPALTRRDVRLPAVPGKAVAVIGMRRTGKTMLMWQVLTDRLSAGLARERLLYFSFEDERLAGMTGGDLHLLVDEYYQAHPDARAGRRGAWFLDEIQVVPGWEPFVRRLLDTEPLDLFISGSSARLLSREVATSMRGRAMEAVVHPFSFREYLRHAGREPTRRADRLAKAERSVLERDLRAYLRGGGFPEAQDASPRDRLDLLRGYVDVALLRDVIERHAVSHPVALRWMTRQLLGNAAGHFSVNKFYGDLRGQGIAVGKDTLHDYLAHLEDAFLVRTVSVAAGSMRRRMVNPRKVYPIDPGLIPVFDRTGRATLGHALETSILLELDRRGADVSYVKTSGGFEVDFLAHHADGHDELIQVAADLDDPDVREREIRALREAATEHPRARLHLIALDRPVARDLPRGMTLTTASSWLLDR
jgi:predicted AAA+ superfamily ATPase